MVNCDVPPGRMLTWYGGVVHTEETWNPRSNYVVRVPLGDSVLLVDGEKRGTVASRINHSCDPNCVMEVFIFHKTLILGIVSKRLIRSGEFLSISYGDQQFDGIKTCMCMSKNCRDREKREVLNFDPLDTPSAVATPYKFT